MNESDRLLPSLKSRLINQRDDRAPKRARSRGASNTKQLTTTRDNETIAISRDIRIRASDAIKAANTVLCIAIILAAPFISLEAKVRARQVLRDGISLPLWRIVDIRESAAGAEARGCDFLVLPGGFIRRQIRGPYGEDIRTRREELRVEHVVVGAHASARIGVGREPRYARVAGGDHDGGSLEAEFHDLGALPLLVGCRQL
ncbi:hypothetical protein RRF57_009912 [Xylaria bambusicola]|uniref:Uncharacterized protein n=1 Tax=Xylaria bambusicola TaxID=326684 RepID=A0AAN7URE2_9PEZI